MADADHKVTSNVGIRTTGWSMIEWDKVWSSEGTISIGADTVVALDVTLGPGKW